MINPLRNWIGAGLAFVVVGFAGWYSGVDFFARGADKAFWVLEASLTAAAVSAFLKLTTRFVRCPYPKAYRPMWTAGAFSSFVAWGWYAGVDYGVRGDAQAAISLCAVMLAVLTWFSPVWKLHEFALKGQT